MPGETFPIGSVGGEKAIVKHQRGTNLLAGPFMEAAVDTLDDLLEFDVVPPTAMRLDERGNIVSVQEFVPDATALMDLPAEEWRRINRRDLIKIAIIDIITQQWDRNESNILVTPDYHAYAIDNEYAFESDTDSVAVNKSYGLKIPSDILRKMKDVQKEDFVTAFAGVDPEKVERAWNRKAELERLGKIVNL